MGGENLSQAERASLLGKVEAAAGQAAGLGRGVRDATTRQAVPLDFHYAERIGPAVLRRSNCCTGTRRTISPPP